ncbi:MAG: HAD-IA family hydrolase [Alphaproteobacteria bacterium]|nr:HAD-IA family hydrolase [Alphaproteobacteria bacterium]
MNAPSSPLHARFDAVIFDCDGVLVDSEVLAIKGERAALAELGLDYSPADYVRRFTGLHDGAFMAALRQDYASRFAAEPPADFEERVIEGRRRAMGALQAVAGAGRALLAAKRTTGRVAVASSSRAHFLESKLRRMKLWDLAAPHVYSADLVARGKPAPDIFLYAAERLGADPARALAVEDSVNGVAAARAAGMTVCGFLGGGHCFDGHGERLKDAGADFLAADFERLIAAFGA